MQVIDVTLLEELRSVMGEDFQNLLSTFEGDTAARFKLLEAAAEAGDGEALRSVSHTLKGSALGMGATALSEHFLGLEYRGRESRLDGIALEIANAQRCFGETLIQIDAWLGAADGFHGKVPSVK